jgi:DNA topoisomerase-1
MKLLIVESPGKIRKIQEFLGPEWKVAASVGHVRDMPVKKMGVAAPDFKPEYEPTERGADVLKRLAALVKTADAVYLATDPDREGEAIAWHLADALKLKNPQRITYTEITRSAVLAALASPRSIDMALVRAQEARRVLDRFCGYMVSGPLSRVSGQKMSAGRVQSSATALIVERERVIQDFVSTTHYGADLSFENLDNITDGWKAGWLLKEWLEDDGEYLTDKALAEKAAALRSLEVLDCKEEESRSAPPAPFTTSSLQQTANTALKFTAKKTMELAQGLYEAGAITYHRTDSPNLSDEAIAAIRTYALEKGLSLPDKPRVWKAKGNAQEAHEAIRPTHADVEEAGETEEHKALYRLIRLRALASQLADAVYAVVALRLGANMEDKQAVFEAKGRKLLAPGWKSLNAAPEEEEGEAAEMNNPVPMMKAGSRATALSGKVLTKSTTPPARYTEASLVRELEKRGIGRPSTYASIIETIKKREYVKLEKDRFVPTPLGVMLLDSLKGKFSFCEFDFTEKMEQSLDEIAEGKAKYGDVLAPAYQTLADEVSAFEKTTGKTCPACGKPMFHRTGKGKNGKPYEFWGCSGWPECGQTL